MPNKTDDKINQQLADLREQAESESGEALQALLSKALSRRNYRIVSVAAKLCEEKLVYGLDNQLIQSFQHFCKNPVKNDPNCIAKGAIVRALVALDCLKADFYLGALHYRQMEPVWGGSVDTATDIRGSAAIGLANTSYPRAAVELAALFADPEVPVRQQLVQAIKLLKPDQAEPLLRLKAVMGDEEPQIIADVLSALIHIEPEDSADFVAGFMQSDNPELVESAIFALGDSAAPEPLEKLIQQYDERVMLSQRSLLIRGIALHRHAQALDWLLEQLNEGSQPVAMIIIESLAEFRRNERVREGLQETLEARGDAALIQAFDQVWELR